ncbi:DNA alkylation repair protein [Corallococcus carmarthensis]|uniref:DNA alkylation repair protein n=1 Tax=Corallococcus carmarthensis TaxID=2316728 RepID=UPI00148D5732|nr:DNA alkylation repair protein [Corallococcus carmarthensis]NOK20734.1 DNA alkylation repair protein [Corallococcus carmarthensis]
MTLEETMRELERLGTEQTRKTYLRHGAPQPLSGVNFGPLAVLKKRIGTDAVLARALWASGHVEARFLATMVVDAPEMPWKELDAWAKGLDWYGLTPVFVTNVVLRSPHAVKALAWTQSKSEWVGQAGWQTLSALLTKTAVLADEDLLPWVKRIEQELPGAKNRVRDAMNSALIALGATGGAVQTVALATAKRLGKVDVDQGDTACKTPDAAQYIRKIQARKEARASAKADSVASAPKQKRAAAKKPGATKPPAATKRATTKPAAKKPSAARTRPRA